jgi:hypothetical protein
MSQPPPLPWDDGHICHFALTQVLEDADNTTTEELEAAARILKGVKHD